MDKKEKKKERTKWLIATTETCMKSTNLISKVFLGSSIVAMIAAKAGKKKIAEPCVEICSKTAKSMVISGLAALILSATVSKQTN